MLCWDGKQLIMRADNAESAEKWVKSLNRRIFEFGVPPPAPAPAPAPEQTIPVDAHDAPLTDEICSLLANYAIADSIDLFRSLAIRNGRVLTKLKTIMDTTRTNLLHLCCKHNSHQILDFLLSSKSVNIDDLNAAGETPLFIAVARGSFECVQLLLNSFPAASFNLLGIGGASCVHVAAGLGSVQMLNELLQVSERAASEASKSQLVWKVPEPPPPLAQKDALDQTRHRVQF